MVLMEPSLFERRKIGDTRLTSLGGGSPPGAGNARNTGQDRQVGEAFEFLGRFKRGLEALRQESRQQPDSQATQQPAKDDAAGRLTVRRDGRLGGFDDSVGETVGGFLSAMA